MKITFCFKKNRKQNANVCIHTTRMIFNHFYPLLRYHFHCLRTQQPTATEKRKRNNELSRKSIENKQLRQTSSSARHNEPCLADEFKHGCHYAGSFWLCNIFSQQTQKCLIFYPLPSPSENFASKILNKEPL